MLTLDKIVTDSSFVSRIPLVRISWELFPVTGKAVAKNLRKPAKGFYFSSAGHRVSVLFKMQLIWPDRVSIYFSIYSYYSIRNIIHIFIYVFFRSLQNCGLEEFSGSCVVQPLQWRQGAGLLRNNHFRLLVVFYNWLLITKDGDFQLLCMIGFRAVQKLFLMLSRHHKSQLVAAVPCFTIWHCQEFDSCGWRCPSSFMLLACFSVNWKSPVLSICSIRQVAHYLACLLLSNSQFSCISLELRHKIENVFQVQLCILTWIELKIIIYLYQLTTAFLMKSCVGFVCHSLVLLDLLFTATPRPFGWYWGSFFPVCISMWVYSVLGT